jgi:hypothetical protein
MFHQSHSPPATPRELNQRETLTFLCEAEIARKDQRRIAKGLSIAKFPFVRTLERSYSVDKQCSSLLLRSWRQT